MKYWRYALLSFGFLFQYIMPIIIFGMVVPYTRGQLGNGLTGAGVVALAIIVIIVSTKIKEFLKTQPRCWLRALILSVFPIAIWCILGIGLDGLLTFVGTLIDYWWFALSFIILGRVFFIIEEALNGSK